MDGCYGQEGCLQAHAGNLHKDDVGGRWLVYEPGALHDGQYVSKLARNKKKERKRTYHRPHDAVGVSIVDSGQLIVKCQQWKADRLSAESANSLWSVVHLGQCGWSTLDCVSVNAQLWDC